MAKTAKFFTKIVTSRVVLNHVNIFEPRAVREGEEAKYTCQILIEKTDSKLVDKIKAAIEETKKAGVPLWGGTVPESLKTPLRDGDVEQLGDEYEGRFFMNLANKVKPLTVDRQLKEIKDPREIYAGCYGCVSLNLFPYYHENGSTDSREIQRGIGAALLNVQKLADGEPLGRTRPEDEFEAVEDEEDILS